MRLIDADKLKDMIAEAEVIDFTIDGKCSNCGECCTTFLVLSDQEEKTIRNYVKKHHIETVCNVKPPMWRTIDLTCPFLDRSREHKCLIYNVRPLICRKFICGKGKEAWEPKELLERKPVNMREIF
jgi:Fe-S-cluster containining protein